MCIAPFDPKSVIEKVNVFIEISYMKSLFKITFYIKLFIYSKILVLLCLKIVN